MVVSGGYPVKMCSKDTVAAVLPLQDHRLPLSNLDLVLPPIDFGLFLCYKATPDTVFADMAGRLKASLAKVLVAYYPLAGEVGTNSAGEPELLCNNRGVDFIEAYADVELTELELYDPDENVEAKLVPKKKDGVLCVQVTELRCGGLVLSCTFDHRICDAYSANMFLVAWAETAASKPIVVPTFNKSLLSPRHPSPAAGGHINALIDHLFVPLSSLPPPPENPPPPSPAQESINRIYIIKSDDIDRIQAMTSQTPGEERRRRSKLEAFSGYLWQLIARGAEHVAPGAHACSMGVVVDGRARLGGDMECYFGNVLSIPYGTLEVAEVAGMKVAELANVVHESLRGAVTEEHFRGVVDWVEELRPEAALARVYCGAGEVAVVVSSGQRFPVGEVEFGWGKAVFGSYHFPWGGGAGYVMPMPSARGNGDWVVYVHLMRGLVEVLEVDDVFQRITPNYVMTSSSSSSSTAGAN